MNISPISLRLNSINQNSQLKKANLAQNPIQESNLSKVSLDNLQAMNNISFKGGYDYDNLNLLDVYKTIKSPMFKLDSLGQTFFHKCSYEELLEKKDEITPLALEVGLLLKNSDGLTPLDTSSADKINFFYEVLGKRKSEKVFLRSLMKSNGLFRMDAEQTQAIIKGLGNCSFAIVEDIILNKLDNSKRSVLHTASAEQTGVLLSALDFRRRKYVVQQAMSMRDELGNTIIHGASAKKLRLIADALEYDAPNEFIKAIFLKGGKNGSFEKLNALDMASDEELETFNNIIGVGKAEELLDTYISSLKSQE